LEVEDDTTYEKERLVVKKKRIIRELKRIINNNYQHNWVVI